MTIPRNLIRKTDLHQQVARFRDGAGAFFRGAGLPAARGALLSPGRQRRLQSEDDNRRSAPAGPAGDSSFGGGADSSNRPWETDSLRIGVAHPPPALGLLAICAAALLTVADMALLYSADGGYGFAGYGSLASLAELPRWRLLLGHYLGILLLPAYIPGYWLVLEGLREAGPWRSWPVFLLGSYAAAIGGAFHGLIALLALIGRHNADDPAASAELLAQARAFADPLHGLLSALLVLTSIWFAVAVLSGHTRFPRWLAAANPLLLGLAFVAPYLAAPELWPTRLAAPAAFNLAHLVFFILVTAALRKRRPS